jgi:hypothetical protein
MFNRKGQWIVILMFSSVLEAADCARGGDVWIVPGSTSQHLRFRVGRWRDDYRSTVISVFTIARIDPSGIATPVWTFHPSVLPAQEIVYDSEGNTTDRKLVRPLPPGLYKIDTQFGNGLLATD